MAIKITGPLLRSGTNIPLGDLSDVTISSVQNGQIIKYNSTSGDWENGPFNVTGGLTYKGSFNATTGAPSLANALQGDFYVIGTAGTIYGQDWAVGDHLLINEDMGGTITNSKIDKIDNTDQVTSVNGQTGVVVLDTDDVAEGAANEYFTDAKADARADVRIAAADLTDLNDVSYTAGPGIDNYVLTYDNTAGTWGAEAAATAPVDSVNGQTGVVVLDTDDVAEGAANEYFTDAKADARIAAADLTDLNDVSYTAGPAIDNHVLTYDDTAGTWGAEALPSAPVDSVNGQTGVVVLDTDDVAEGAANEYFTDAKADARADVRIAASDLNALNDVSYTAGPAIDNYVLTYDDTAGTWGAEVATVSRPTVYSVSASTTIGADTTIGSGELERIYIVDSASAVTMTLPQITGNVGNGYKLNLKRDGANVVTITPNAADNIDGAADGASITLSVDKAAFTLVCDGTNWQII